MSVRMKELSAESLKLTHLLDGFQFEVEPACRSNAKALLPAIQKTLETGLAPEQVQADSLYGSDDNCQQAAELGVEVISPAMGVEKRESGSLSGFQLRSSVGPPRSPHYVSYTVNAA